MELHARAWRIAALQRLGRWDEALVEFLRPAPAAGGSRRRPALLRYPRVRSGRCDLRTAGQSVWRATAWPAAILRMVTGSSGRLYPTLLRFLVVRGDLAEAKGIARPHNWQVHAGGALEAEAERLAATGESGRSGGPRRRDAPATRRERARASRRRLRR